MIRIEKLFFGFIIRAIIPIILFLASWWIFLVFTKNEKIIASCATAGLIFGIIISLIILKRQTDCYKLSNKSLVFIYLFYNVCFLGVFMGIPFFNLSWGLIAGIYFGRKLSLESADNTKVKSISKKISFFTAIVMGFIVTFSTVIVLLDKYRLKNIKGTLGLSFNITPSVLLVMVFAGGIALIISQYWITKLSVLNVFRISKKTR